MNQVNSATMMITLSDKDKRKATIWEVIDAVQKEALATIPTEESVTEASANVLLRQALLLSAQSTVTAEQEQVRMTQIKVNDGSLAPVDLLREQAAEADAQSSANQAQTSVNLANVNRGRPACSRASHVACLSRCNHRQRF